ncbi:MAG: histidine kinase [Microbacteriaceae bacterium]|nr:MAG: histidine kinase [Microbacteriaceae bacterium]
MSKPSSLSMPPAKPPMRMLSSARGLAVLILWPAHLGLTGAAAYCMLLIYATLVGLNTVRRIRIIAPTLLAIYAAAVPLLIVLPRFASVSVADQFAAGFSYPVSLFPYLLLLLYCGMAALLAIGCWYLGLRLARTRRAQATGEASHQSAFATRVDTALRFLRPALEPSIAVVFYLLWIVAEAGRSGNWPWPSFPFTLGLLAASIAMSRQYPRAAVALPGAVLAIQLVFVPTRYSSTTWPVYLGVLLTCLIVSASGNRRIRWLALPIMGVYALVASTLMTVPALSDGYGWTSWTGQGIRVLNVVSSFFTILVIGLILTAGAWLIGFGLRARRLQQAADAKLGETVSELHSAEIDLIIASERDRIAQDVHDIMAHSLSVIIAQADGARFIGPTRPEAINESLERIAASARTSLTEVRMLIESLVDDPDGHSNPHSRIWTSSSSGCAGPASP